LEIPDVSSTCKVQNCAEFARQNTQWYSHILFESYFVQILNTTMGVISIELFVKEAPKTVENFVTHRYSSQVQFMSLFYSMILQAIKEAPH
jgi:hypothetical protein